MAVLAAGDTDGHWCVGVEQGLNVGGGGEELHRPSSRKNINCSCGCV